MPWAGRLLGALRWGRVPCFAADPRLLPYELDVVRVDSIALILGVRNEELGVIDALYLTLRWCAVPCSALLSCRSTSARSGLEGPCRQQLFAAAQSERERLCLWRVEEGWGR